MQGLTIDTLASKHIPAASKMSSLPRLVAEYATQAIRTGQDHSVAARLVADAARPIPAVSVEQAHTYTGRMQMSGSFSDSVSGANANFSGSLKDTLYAVTDSTGNGSGYEIFTGNLTISGTDANGNPKTTSAPFDFDTPDFTIQRGHFTVSQQQNYEFELFLTLKISGSLVGTRATMSESLHTPFNGIIGNSIITGSLNGSSSLNTTPLAISGTASGQTAYGGSKMAPFHNLVITDLNATTVTATVTLSKPANGTVTDLGGGTYNQATGVYTITGGGAAVNRAVRNLMFDPASNLNVFNRNVLTAFTLKITDARGASLTNRATSVVATTPLAISGTASGQIAFIGSKITPFRNLRITDHNATTLTVTVKLSNPAHGTLTNLAAGTYNRAKGVYTITGGRQAVNHILAGLAFDPVGKKGAPDASLSTGFTLSVTDGTGASLSTGKTSVTAVDPLTILGIVDQQTTPAAKAIAPFRNVTITDAVSGEIDFVKITLSNPGNGSLVNLAGGFYNKKIGVYRIQGSAAAITKALRGLTFDPATSSGSAASTSFTLSVRNAAGAARANSSTTVVVNPATSIGTGMWSFSYWGVSVPVIANSPTPAATTGTGLALFSQYVAAGLHAMPDHAAGISALHDLPQLSHLDFAGSHR
jgi:hypothetical protein